MEVTLEFPSRFTVVPFENVIDSLVKAKQEEVAFIKSAKKDLLDYISKRRQVEALEKFVVIKGNRRIYAKISQIIRDTTQQLSVATTVPGLMRGDRFGVLDVAFNHPLRSKIEYRFLTDFSKDNLNALKALVKRVPKTGFNFKARNPDLGIDLFPRMIIRDGEEILFYTSKPERTDRATKEEVCLWTNCRSLVQAFEIIFEDLWRKSTDIRKKIVEIETGKPTPTTRVMTDAETIQKYYETLQSAEEEIMLVTSSKGLIEYWKQQSLIEKWKKNGVQVKIMAPIVHENSEAAQQLQKTLRVRHVPENHIVATIVDGRHLFQFRTQPTVQETLDSSPNFENTLYTNEHEYIEKMKTTLNDIWKKARAPSAATLEAITGSYGPPSPNLFFGNAVLNKTRGIKIMDIEPPGTLTEKEVLDKIIYADKIMARDQAKDVSRMYASIGTAVIHPPDNLNLPKMLIKVDKIEKQSTLGAGEALTIFLRLHPRSSTEYTYVPVAALGDNPKGQESRKAMFAGSPAGENVQLVRKDELQVRVHGNTMFAGWTVPVRLYPPSCVLPPACLVIEGYGNVKTSGFTMLDPSGFKWKIEENYFDAFVTFMHPSSKYSGPGTDAVFVRDYIATIFPPKSSSRLE